MSDTDRHIVIIRHGERADSNLSKPLNTLTHYMFNKYSFDSFLTSHGKASAQDLGEYLSQTVPMSAATKIYSSPFVRCMWTACEIQKAFPDCGIFQERKVTEYQPQMIYQTHLYPKGTIPRPETYPEFCDRTIGFIQELMSKGMNAFVVTHAEAVKVVADYCNSQIESLLIDTSEIPFLCTLVIRYSADGRMLNVSKITK